MSDIKHLAIKTGSTYTLVEVDAGANQCTVACVGGGKLVHGGTSKVSIQRAARDSWGVSYKTLTELRASTSASVTRRRDLDV